jgi:site-specific recombinase XerD
MNKIISEYEAWLHSWASEDTTRARVVLASARLDAWGLSGFTAENISTWLGEPSKLTGKPLSKWSKATYHAHLKDFCKFLVATGRLDESPMEDVRAVKRPKNRPRPIEQRDLDRLLAFVQGEVRDWLLLALLAGLRVSEIAKIRGEDVSIDGIYVLGKGDVDAMLPCHPDLWAMAQRYPRTGYWFPGSEDGHIPKQQISNTVGRVFRAIGIPKGSIHRGRHTYATNLLRNGEHIRKVQKLMRHSNLETTAGYTAVDEDELRSAVGRLPSLNPPALPESA